MKKKTAYHFGEIIDTLKRLHDAYPGQSIGQHLALATGDYPTIDMTDKELLFALSKYEQELELNESFTTSPYEDNISDWEEYDDKEEL